MTAKTDHGSEADRLKQRLLAGTPLRERELPLAGVNTAVHEYGEGPPIVLLHGQGEFWGVWMGVVDALARTHRVVAADLPGHGASVVHDNPLDREGTSRWVDALVDATCPEPPVLAGHLLGGAIAARYAVSHSPRLEHLVLVDTMGLAWYWPSLRFAVPMVGFMARPTPRSRDRLFDKCFLDFDAVGAQFGPHWEDLRDYALDRARTSGNQEALRTLMPKVGVPPIPAEELDRITVPTTLIHGRHDLQVPLRVAQRASERHGWPLFVVDEARDDPAAEQPDAVVHAIQKTLDDHARRGAAR